MIPTHGISLRKGTVTRRNRFVIILASAVAVVAVATVAAGATSTFGNAAVPRPRLDTFSAFTIVDTAATASATGVVTRFRYYAAAVRSFRFVLVDSTAGKKVLWVSDDIRPAAVGAATYTPVTPVPVRAGNAVGVYSDSLGVIPYTLNSPTSAGSGPDVFTGPGQPVPTAGATLPFAGITDRDYSYNADEQACSFAVGRPIAADGSSVFKSKRGVIPVKLAGCDNANLAPQLSLTRLTGASPGPVGVTSASAADRGTTMRFQKGGRYMYNLAAKSLGRGTYALSIRVNGIAVVTVGFALR
jgi:hypothetical protein